MIYNSSLSWIHCYFSEISVVEGGARHGDLGTRGWKGSNVFGAVPNYNTRNDE